MFQIESWLSSYEEAVNSLSVSEVFLKLQKIPLYYLWWNPFKYEICMQFTNKGNRSTSMTSLLFLLALNMFHIVSVSNYKLEG